MTVYITFTSFGSDAGPFNLYSNVDGYTSAFAAGVSKAQLLAGFPSNSVPDGTTIVRAKSFGVCNNFVDIPISNVVTTTTSSTAVPVTTTTTTPPATTTTTTTATLFRLDWEHQHDDYIEESSFGIYVNGVGQVASNLSFVPSQIVQGFIMVPQGAEVVLNFNSFNSVSITLSAYVIFNPSPQDGEELTGTSASAEVVFIMPGANSSCMGSNYVVIVP